MVCGPCLVVCVERLEQETGAAEDHTPKSAWCNSVSAALMHYNMPDMHQYWSLVVLCALNPAVSLTFGIVATMRGVQMGPGATALTLMPLLTNWLDSERVNASCTKHKSKPTEW
jgi:hypothetical protein